MLGAVRLKLEVEGNAGAEPGLGLPERMRIRPEGPRGCLRGCLWDGVGICCVCRKRVAGLPSSQKASEAVKRNAEERLRSHGRFWLP